MDNTSSIDFGDNFSAVLELLFEYHPTINNEESLRSFLGINNNYWSKIKRGQADQGRPSGKLTRSYVDEICKEWRITIREITAPPSELKHTSIIEYSKILEYIKSEFNLQDKDIVNALDVTIDYIKMPGMLPAGRVKKLASTIGCLVEDVCRGLDHLKRNMTMVYINDLAAKLGVLFSHHDSLNSVEAFAINQKIGYTQFNNWISQGKLPEKVINGICLNWRVTREIVLASIEDLEKKIMEKGVKAKIGTVNGPVNIAEEITIENQTFNYSHDK